MKLARFLQDNMERLLEDWEKAVLDASPPLANQDRGTLRNRARSMLEFIALGKGETPSPGISGAPDASRRKQGLAMLQMIEEVQTLRASVTAAWGTEQGGLSATDIDELVGFNAAVDQLVSRTVSDYAAVREQEAWLFDTIGQGSLDPAAIYDTGGRHLFINTAMANLLELPQAEVIGKTALELGLNLATELHDAIARAITTGQAQGRELHYFSKAGRELYFDCQLMPVFNEGHEVEAVVNTTRDITDRKKADHDVWHSANFDPLTGIPNRRLFTDRLAQTLLEAQRNGNPFTLLFIDLDRFKEANDQLGHDAGDRLLVQVAQRINTSVRAVDTLARLGGDEFTLILKNTGREGAKEAARALQASLEQAFHVDNHRVHISSSIGMTFFPEDGTNIRQLMHNADQAMYAAKENGGQQVQVYEPGMARSESEYMRLNRELSDALRENQLEVYYQPIIDIRTGAIARAEALLRWNHPSKGLMTPDSFLSITEQSGMTNSITAFVLEQAMICSLRWRDLHDNAFPININESPASFVTRSLVDEWRARLTQAGLDQSQITLELTPASFNNIRASGFNPISSLGLAGVRLHLAIDDFGIKPFSLSMLQDCRMESVKIDRDLIRNAGQGGDADDVLEAIIAMAHAIHTKVIGVGVERIEQLNFLARSGCDYAQGFLFSQPLNQENFEALLQLDRQTSH